MTNLDMTGPKALDRELCDFSRKLFAGATHGQQYAFAWASLASLFSASSVHLLRGHAAPPGARVATSAVHLFDGHPGHLRLPASIAIGESDHGLFAIARFLPAGVDAIVMLRKADPFTEGERGWMELLLAQIRAALELGDQLASPLPTLASALQLAQLLPTACVLTDELGRCIERNRAFGRVLEATSGTVRDGRVAFDDPFLQDSWQQALEEGRKTAATQSLLATTSSGDEWKVHVVPFPCFGGPAGTLPRQLMFALFERSAGADAQKRPVAASRPLTKAELEVLASLLLGQSAKVIARTRGASVNTVRSQIATILGKTGHRSQKELMASTGISGYDGIAELGARQRR